jgi:hypothetical protein
MKYFNLALSTGLLAVGLASAQVAPAPASTNPPTKGSRETVQETKTTTDSGTTKTSTDTVFGKVEDFVAGKSIKVSTPGTVMTSRSFDLQGKDITSHVSSTIRKGAWVNVVEKTDNNGHKMVNVTPSTHAAK